MQGGLCGLGEEIVEVCDSLEISYTLVLGNNIDGPVVEEFKDVTKPGVYFGGLDLTDLSKPKLDKSKLTLPGGRYALFVTINGKSQKVAAFRIALGEDGVEQISRLASARFTVKNSAPSTLTISRSGLGQSGSFAIMDIQGRVVRRGVLDQSEVVVPNLRSGAYVVKLGGDIRPVKIR